MSLGDGRLVLQEGDYTITLSEAYAGGSFSSSDIGYTNEKRIAHKSPEREIAIIKGYENKKVYVSIEAQDKANALQALRLAREILYKKYHRPPI